MAIRPLPLAFLMLVLLLPEAAAATTSRIIVKREPGLSAVERADIRADAGVRYVESLPLPRTEVVAASRGEVRDALRELNADPDVVYAEPDYTRRAAAPPDDEHFDFLWALHNTGQETPDFPPAQDVAGTFDADMDVLEAWDQSSGAGQLVAVVDSGIESTHEDLADNVAPGYDWVDKDSDPRDLTGHGTLVAGTIAALRGNGTGIAGVAPEARILPLRVLDEDDSGSVSDIVGAFDFAGDAGVRVVNASFADGSYSQAEHDVIAAHPDTLFVVAAGNRGSGEDGTTPAYPCAYPAPNIICVGASDADDAVPGFSNLGPTVDLFAPGDRIFSTYHLEDASGNDAYNLVSGTSMAAPHVAGEAALVLARNPGLDVPALKAAVLGTGDEDDAFEQSVTGRRANALAALESVEADRDGDGDPDEVDNCVEVPKTVDDTCELSDPDSDGDGIPDAYDACPYDRGLQAAQGCPGTASNSDADPLLDIFDNCDAVANPDQADGDKDGIGDACDPDLDNDGHANERDNCPVNYNPSQADFDGDGIGNACDPTPRGHNNDGDHVWQIDDACPDVFGTLANGCPVPPNRDGDDRVDALDACPSEYAITKDGCPLAQIAALSGKVRKRGSRRSVTVKVVTTRLANVRMTIERKSAGRWRRVKSRRVATVANRASVAATRIRPGRYRVRVTVSSGAGSGTPVSKRFRVR